MRTRQTLAALLVTTALGASGPATAVLIEFDPAISTVALGGGVSVDVVVSEPGGPLPLIGAFDIKILFDDALLDLVSVDFGAGLGGDAFSQTVVPGIGMVDVAEFGLFPALFQTGAPFTLFTLNFTGAAEGVSVLTMAGNIPPGGDFLGDEFGVAPIPVAGPGTGTVEVTPAAVPEPAPLALLVLALALLALARVRRPARLLPRS